MTAATHEEFRPDSDPASRNRLFRFLIELRRRRVCRAVTFYSVAMWLVCQIVDVISPALELPDWTMKLVIVFGLLGLPIIIITSWLFEITPDGLIIEGRDETGSYPTKASGRKHIAERLIDCSLILAALAIGVQLSIGELYANGGNTEAAQKPLNKIAVMPFLTTTDADTARLSDVLTIELQHTLAKQLDLTVIVSSNPKQLKGSMSLTGAVSITQSTIRVAVTMIDFDSGKLIWSDVFEVTNVEPRALPAELAQKITAAISLLGDKPKLERIASAAE